METLQTTTLDKLIQEQPQLESDLMTKKALEDLRKNCVHFQEEVGKGKNVSLISKHIIGEEPTDLLLEITNRAFQLTTEKLNTIFEDLHFFFEPVPDNYGKKMTIFFHKKIN